ncbi:E3 ubiquitin-protein ligase MARCH5-like [Acyrthosiphon pisum]|uniref:E3 ubiquitin-protein ligase MARCHF5 n=1 Tax=Acyrthosiphon pisum TaxID=7029 RepID=A0A8R1W4S9_ACYPI|nr:E3 ubiquitin-protein ligase MARCH5-like [Acyrthosiphon pisum]|eukprot:XP_001945331.2 PREDICTED: E3 ubiquitin-protein ligase MARCH5-like [Acyrthosiphon pisum]
MENASTSQRSTSFSQETYEQKHCWICFGTDDEDYESNRDWVSPCKCRGSTRWVHQDCVQRWVDEKLNENLSVKPHCPQCQTQYIIVYHEVNYIIRILNTLDKTANQLCPFLATGFMVSALYWSAASYGAITMMQVMGEREAITMMENTDSYMLLLVLPSIPLSLILGKTVNWEDTLMLFVQRFTSQLPLLRTIMPSFLYEPVNNSTSIVQFNSVVNLTTTLCTALLLPTAATVVGHLLFDNSSYSYLQKTLLGGLVYIAVKGVFRIYQRQHNIIKERTRKVINYPETGTEENN